MEKELNDFKIEVLTQLAVINSELDGYNKTQEIARQADNRSKQNELDGYRVVQGIPENRNTWHAGDGRNGKGNRNKISAEICHSTGTDEEIEQ